MTARRSLLGGAAGLLALAAVPRVRAAPQPVVVGALAVTCNLTLPLACEASGQQFEFSRYTGWPEVKESLMTGRIKAAYMLAPLMIDLADRNIPVKVVSLGHRSGAVIMVRTDSPYKSFRDLRGKLVAIPSRFAVDFLFLRKMLQREGMTEKDVRTIELAPADMPAALYAKAVDAYCTGEPFGAVAQRAGYARLLSMTRDHWPAYMCCVLSVHESLIRENREAVQSLVNHVLATGEWLDRGPANRQKGIEIAARRKYFNQDVNVLKFVMENPADRVTYGDLRLVRKEFEELMQLSIDAGTIKHHVPYEKYVDESFYKAARPARISL